MIVHGACANSIHDPFHNTAPQTVLENRMDDMIVSVVQNDLITSAEQTDRSAVNGQIWIIHQVMMFGCCHQTSALFALNIFQYFSIIKLRHL
jgi:hypothetical protein